MLAVDSNYLFTYLVIVIVKCDYIIIYSKLGYMLPTGGAYWIILDDISICS